MAILEAVLLLRDLREARATMTLRLATVRSSYVAETLLYADCR